VFAHLAAFTIRRRRLVLVLSVTALLLMSALGATAFSTLKSGGFDDPSSESSRAATLVDTTFGGQTNLVLLLTPHTGQSLDSRDVSALARQITTSLGQRDDVGSLRSYWTDGSATLRGADQRSGLITLHVAGDDAASAQAAGAIIAEFARDFPVATVQAGGQLGVGDDLLTGIGHSLAVAEAIAVPLTLVLLVVAFGNVLAAMLPLGIGVLAVAGTFAELAVLGRLTDVSIYAINLTTALGLGLAVDYSLLMVNRFREELQQGADVDAAVTTTVRTAGRTIAFSSATVGVALAALLSFPVYFLRSFAYAGIGVVVIAMLASLITLPALLATLGPRLARGRLQARRTAGESLFWRRVATAVMRRPVAVAVPVVAVLLVAGIPFLHVAFGTPDDRVLHASATSRQVGDVLRSQYPAAASSPIDVLVEGSPTTASVTELSRTISALPGVTSIRPPVTADTSTYLVVSGPPDASSTASQDLVRTLRSLPSPDEARVLVGGATATLLDSKDAISSHLPWALLWIVLTTLVLLFLFTGSVVLPVKALALNAVSLSAVLGILVWIFQDGHLAGLLGFTPTPLNTAMIVLMFCVAFGLSMDYEVFLLARITEAHDQGASTTEAVATGLARTGRIVTTAAALLAITFLAFGTAQISFLQLFGIGTGVAILVDATIIRGLLVPAFMRLAGDLNWTAPRPLQRLHQRLDVQAG
jgi:RND superfamily putative drug exporter